MGQGVRRARAGGLGADVRGDGQLPRQRLQRVRHIGGRGRRQGQGARPTGGSARPRNTPPRTSRPGTAARTAPATAPPRRSRRKRARSWGSGLPTCTVVGAATASGRTPAAATRGAATPASSARSAARRRARGAASAAARGSARARRTRGTPGSWPARTEPAPPKKSPLSRSSPAVAAVPQPARAGRRGQARWRGGTRGGIAWCSPGGAYGGNAGNSNSPASLVQLPYTIYNIWIYTSPFLLVFYIRIYVFWAAWLRAVPSRVTCFGQRISFEVCVCLCVQRHTEL
mmetsp:Transcript_8782/g.21717  ORF Transcript_8782/g.21717 Transcript_8782/m.21717 type:complete len:286 (-) Transcript_8782:52-909(-)